MRFRVVALLMAALGFLAGCGSPTLPDQPQIRDFTYQKALVKPDWRSYYTDAGDGAVLGVGDLVRVSMRFWVYGEEGQKVILRARFVRADGNTYQDQTQYYGPYLASENQYRYGYRYRDETFVFRVSDGLLEFSRGAPGKPIGVWADFLDGDDQEIESIPLPFRFTVQ